MTAREPAARQILKRVTITPNDCWEWGGYVGANGYGSISLRGKVRSVHRAAYETLVAPIPEGLHIDHLCRNRVCINPDHLEPVTPTENLRRQGAAITHCPSGHQYSEANTTYNSRGSRICRRCHSDHQQAYIARKKGVVA